MSKQLVFIDDSGDPGFKEGASANFLMAAALFNDPVEATRLSRRISEYRRSLGWRDDYEFKFAKIRKDIIIEALKIARKYDFRVYAVYVDKANFRQVAPIIDGEKLYDWMIKELLMGLSLSDAKIKIDGRSGKLNMKRTATYLRREVNHKGNKKIVIKFEDSTKNDLLQLADLIAGSIGRSMSDKTDSKTYIDIIKDKIFEIKQINQR